MNDRRDAQREDGFVGTLDSAQRAMSGVAMVAAPLLLRAGLAVPFFRSGLTKWDGFLELSPAANYLFQEEFKFHAFGQAYDLPAPDVLAFATASAEIMLPVLLVLGLFTRFSALALLCMTAVIQFIVPDGWANFHLPWAALAVALIAIGPGRFSFDHVLRARFGRNAP